MTISQLTKIANGDDATPDQYNILVDAINLLLAQAITNGGTVGDVEVNPSTASGAYPGTPDGSGNFNISYGVSFDEAPSVTVSGSGGRPNTLVTISESQPGPNAFTVHCQDVTTGNPVTTGTVTVNWQATRKS